MTCFKLTGVSELQSADLLLRLLLRFLSPVVQMLCGCYIHIEDQVQYDLCDSSVCSREIIFMFLVNQVSEYVENFNIGIFSDTINVINVNLCWMILHIELYVFIILSVTLTLFQGDSSVKQF